VPRVISSSLTFFYKFIFPLVWIAGFGAGTITILVDRPPNFPWLIFPIFWVAGSVMIYWLCVRLKRVAIDVEGLVVCNYAREIRVPWASISEVAGSRMINPPHITVTFNHDMGFGTSIIFMPPVRLLWPFQEHPAVQELRDLVLVHRNRR
jgi:hypothetical protein